MLPILRPSLKSSPNEGVAGGFVPDANADQVMNAVSNRGMEPARRNALSRMPRKRLDSVIKVWAVILLGLMIYLAVM